MEYNLKPGLSLSTKHIVSEDDLACTLGTGDVKHAATPSLLILMERVICDMLKDRIPEEYTTVSAEINIKHMIPLFTGDQVSCSVHLKFAEDSKLFFDFAIFNIDDDIVAIGAHERVIIKKEE